LLEHVLGKGVTEAARGPRDEPRPRVPVLLFLRHDRPSFAFLFVVLSQTRGDDASSVTRRREALRRSQGRTPLCRRRRTQRLGHDFDRDLRSGVGGEPIVRRAEARQTPEATRGLAVCLRGGGRSERGPSDTDGVAAVAQAAE
jgi:hypothetical protein